MAPRNTRTLLVNSGGFPRGTSHADMVEAISEALEDEIESVQVCPGRLIRITFLDAEAKKIYEEIGTISFGSVACETTQPEVISVVLVHLFPFEGHNSKIEEALKGFGVIKEIKYQTWTNVPGLYTGTRIVRMFRKLDIPRNIKIDGLPCKIWYKDQPIECDICRGAHKAASCPLKGKCRRCRKEGHFASDCPNPPWTPLTDVVTSKLGSVPLDPTPAESASKGPVPVVVSQPAPTEAVTLDPAPAEVVASNNASVSPTVDMAHALVDADGRPVDSWDCPDLRDNQLDEVVSQLVVENSSDSSQVDCSPLVSSQSILENVSVLPQVDLEPSSDSLAAMQVEGLSPSDVPVEPLASSVKQSVGAVLAPALVDVEGFVVPLSQDRPSRHSVYVSESALSASRSRSRSSSSRHSQSTSPSGGRHRNLPATRSCIPVRQKQK